MRVFSRNFSCVPAYRISFNIQLILVFIRQVSTSIKNALTIACTYSVFAPSTQIKLSLHWLIIQ